MYHQSQHTSLFQHWSARFHPKTRWKQKRISFIHGSGELHIFKTFPFYISVFTIQITYPTREKYKRWFTLWPFARSFASKKISGTLFLESCKLVSVIAPFGLEMPEPIYKPFVLVNNANLPDSLSFSLNAWFSFSEETEKGTKMLVAFEREDVTTFFTWRQSLKSPCLGGETPVVIEAPKKPVSLLSGCVLSDLQDLFSYVRSKSHRYFCCRVLRRNYTSFLKTT